MEKMMMPDTLPHGGRETEVDPREIAIAHAKAEAHARIGRPKEGVVDFITTVPYVGGEPIVTPYVRRPIDPRSLELSPLNLP